MSAFSFTVSHSDAATRARAGVFETPHGPVRTPTFMPCGTKGTVKTLRVQDLRDIGVQMLLGNTYHLALRPGLDVIEAAGGLHAFMRWDGPILTDSGGFQVFSLADRSVLDEDGVTFSTEIDGGAPHRLTPEEVIRIQRVLGSDVFMPLDHVIPPGPEAATRDALARTTRWLDRAAVAHRATDDGRSVLFPIVQGGVHAELRREACRTAAPYATVGIAIGGLSVGESKAEMAAMLDVCDAELPRERVRYLMGVGSPEDLVDGIARGVDLFDCVLPTRLARTGSAFTPSGRISMKLAAHRLDQSVIDTSCDCPACTGGMTRAYIRHLVMEKEVLGMVLLSLHNIRFLERLTEQCRAAIIDGTFQAFRTTFLAAYAPMGGRSDPD